MGRSRERQTIEARLRSGFGGRLDGAVDERLDQERGAAVKAFLEEWDHRRREKITAEMIEQFEDGLDDQVERELEKMEAA
jgi:hypothetical protein